MASYFLGFHAAISPAHAAAVAGEVGFEIWHKSGVKATGVEEEGELVVLQGSEALKDAGYQGANAYGELKEELVTQGVLVPSGDGKVYKFARPYALRRVWQASFSRPDAPAIYPTLAMTG